MTVEEGDWRLSRGAHEDLAGVAMCRASYVAPRRDWDHDHCEFCWKNFVDPTYPARFLEGEEATQYVKWLVSADDVITVGFTNAVVMHGNEPGYSWVYPECFEDFTEMVQWSLIECPVGERLRPTRVEG